MGCMASSIVINLIVSAAFGASGIIYFSEKVWSSHPKPAVLEWE